MLGLIPLLFGNLGTPELIIIVVVVLLLFGGKKIPELMRGIGKGVRSFKEGMNDITDEINRPADETTDDKSNKENKK
ncbi:MAG: twin-arginine translocase TatA/TatE family subunit [Muribaculaceae bacterium]|nr:twin-arginine translocase TatA/TatE family subunit [Muribaculaceae bacterium]